MPLFTFPSDMSILIIEDSEIDFLITEAQLKKALIQDINLIWKKTYAEGLSELLSTPPSVALVDYFLMEENGIDLIREAREKGCLVPLILLTAKEDYETDLQAMRAGADEFLVKRQLSPALLERVLRYISKVHRQRQEILVLNQELESRVHQRTSELISTNFALQESERQMELLKEIASVSNASARIEDAFLETMTSISNYTGWPLGHVAMARQDNGENTFFLEASEIWFNADPTHYQSLIEITRQMQVFDQDSVLVKVMQSRKPVWSTVTAEKSANYPRAQIAIENHIRSHLAFPVIVNNQVMAVMEFFSHDQEEFSEVMRKLIHEISLQLGYVVERKQAEADLRQTQKRLTQAQRIARLGSFVGNTHTGILTCSPELQRILHLNRETVSIEVLQNRLHPEDRSKVQIAFEFARQKAVPFYLDFRFQLDDGKEIPVHGQVEVETDPQQQTAQLVGIIQDISERKRIEEVLVRMREAAESANQSKSAFLASMSHEIRTPMNAILGFAQILLRDAQISALQRQHLTTILHSGEHLLSLINDILEVSKIESGRITLHPNPFDLKQLLQDLQGMFAEKLKSKQLSLDIKIASEVPFYFMADEGKLRQVLINLLSNSVKFTESGGIIIRVNFTETESGPRLLWEVEDTGCGIAEEELHKVFSSFEQTASGVRSQSGTGLGMSISRSYVNLMGGSLNLRSQLNQGTCFYFDLPVALTSEIEIQKKTHVHRVTGIADSQTVPSLLLVDDRETNLDLLQAFLSPIGFKMHLAVNGYEAIEGFQKFKPDAILMDSAMPEMDGLEATRRIRQLPGGKDVVILSVSASAFEHDRASILAAGANDFLAKPVKEGDLLDLLKKYLHLEYIYHPSEISMALPAQQPEIVSLADINIQLRQQMAEALECGDLDTLAELSQSLTDAHPLLTEQIQTWCQNFAYDQLNQLFKEPGDD